MTKKDQNREQEIERQVQLMYDTISPALEPMLEAEKTLTQDMLRSYCWFTVNVNELTRIVDREGAIIFGERGLKEHPAVGAIAKLAAKKSDYYAKIMRQLRESGVDASDDLGAFIAGRA